MIQGIVNQRCEATLPLVIGNTSGQRQLVNTVIDTGFNGFLTLPSTIIAALDLPWNASDRVTLGDGRETLFDLYAVTVIWDGQYYEIDVAESDTEPLIGMALLYGYRLQMDIVEGGIVRLKAL
ncbi:MAG: clan AA aspartic protease [Synechococcales cyanobacterium K44_A2020_017]|nr:clan AA aspartic protease [Synechococcales cyanobacterium K32_A2020_035]MBF2093355.1 clan AA aspartic protease [Synechococcales cyanobacterium K44_A2020_017]